MSMDEQSILVGGSSLNVPGARWHRCENCNARVSLAPTGQAFLRSRSDLRLYCERCAYDLWRQDADEVIVLPVPHGPML